MSKHYDVIAIGLGPACMAVAAMSSAMGLKTLAIEKNKVGGECMNVGCVPSKALLKRAKVLELAHKLQNYQLHSDSVAKPTNEIFSTIRKSIENINDNKNSKITEKFDVVFAEAHFISNKIVEANGEEYTADKIFICVGTKPSMPPIAGIDTVEVLTNDNIFNLDEIPASLAIIGGGAIGTEMAQAFARFGAKVSIVHNEQHLIPAGDTEAAEVLEQSFNEEGINVYNKRAIKSVRKEGNEIIITTDSEEIKGEKLLVAAGRKFNYNALGLDKAGIQTDKRGAIIVDDYLETTAKNIYAVGDCNGNVLLSHAAMHQAMIAVMNTLLPRFMRKKFKSYQVPWTVFSEPAFSSVGMSEKELQAKGIKYETVKMNYSDYGVAYIENVDKGFLKVFTSKWGKIYGAVIIGENSGELINEWALAIQSNLRMHHILFTQHSFPTMGFQTKRIAETWLMGRMKSPTLRKIVRILFKL